MSVAGLQYDKFCSEVVAKKSVYTFTQRDELLIYPVHDTDVVPFWSSRTRLLSIAERNPKYTKYAVTVFSLEEFEGWLAQLEEQGMLVGINWSGERLTGYNVAVPDLRAAMKARGASGPITKRSTRLPGSSSR